MPHREPFDPKRPLVAARDFTFAGEPFKPGDPFPKPGTPPGFFAQRLIERQYSAHAVNHAALAADEAALDEAVQMTGPSGGRYKITAPWLDEPIIARGKVPAEKAFAQIKADGPPLGFIAGGSAVEVEETGGGWYAITAPWLADAEKVQGREAAETRQRELHDAGEPDTYGGVTLTEGENGWFIITREGSDVELKVHGADKAREDAATLRAGGEIEGDPFGPKGDDDDNDGDAGEGAEAGQGGNEAPPPPADPEGGADANSANAGTADDAATGAAEQGGTDGPEKSEGAEKAAEGKNEAEAGKSKDDPAAD